MRLKFKVLNYSANYAVVGIVAKQATEVPRPRLSGVSTGTARGGSSRRWAEVARGPWLGEDLAAHRRTGQQPVPTSW